MWMYDASRDSFHVCGSDIVGAGRVWVALASNDDDDSSSAGQGGTGVALVGARPEPCALAVPQLLPFGKCA